VALFDARRPAAGRALAATFLRQALGAGRHPAGRAKVRLRG
jgi:hypothetical protein